MRQGLRAVFAAFAAVALIHFFHFVGAATAQTPVKQIKLTEKQIQNFIAAQKDMAPVAKKLQGSTSDQPAQSEAVAKNSGFKDFAE
jgi:hypothetical protein